MGIILNFLMLLVGVLMKNFEFSHEGLSYVKLLYVTWG